MTRAQFADSVCRLPIRVYIEDTDAGGIVYHANYLKYLERARTEWLRSLGYGKAAMLDGVCLFVVSAMQLDYRAPARLDDELIAEAAVSRTGRASLQFFQRVMREDRILLRADVKIAAVAPDTLRPVALPEKLAAIVRRNMADIE